MTDYGPNSWPIAGKKMKLPDGSVMPVHYTGDSLIISNAHSIQGVQKVLSNRKWYTVIWNFDDNQIAGVLPVDGDTIQLPDGGWTTNGITRWQGSTENRAPGMLRAQTLCINGRIHEVLWDMVNLRIWKVLPGIGDTLTLPDNSRVKIDEAQQLIISKSGGERAVQSLVWDGRRHTIVWNLLRNNVERLLPEFEERIALPDNTFFCDRLGYVFFKTSADSTRAILKRSESDRFPVFLYLKKSQVIGILPQEGKDVVLPDGTIATIGDEAFEYPWNEGIKPSPSFSQIWLHLAGSSNKVALWDVADKKVIEAGFIVARKKKEPFNFQFPSIKKIVVSELRIDGHVAKRGRLYPKGRLSVQRDDSPVNTRDFFSAPAQPVPITSRTIFDVNPACTRALEKVVWFDHRSYALTDLENGKIIKVFPWKGNDVTLPNGSKVTIQWSADNLSVSDDGEWVLQVVSWQNDPHEVIWRYDNGALFRILPKAIEITPPRSSWSWDPRAPERRSSFHTSTCFANHEFVNEYYSMFLEIGGVSNRWILWDIAQEKQLASFPSTTRLKFIDGSTTNLDSAKVLYIDPSGAWALQSVVDSGGFTHILRWDFGPLNRQTLIARKKSLERKIVIKTTEIKRLNQTADSLEALYLPVKKELIRARMELLTPSL